MSVPSPAIRCSGVSYRYPSAHPKPGGDDAVRGIDLTVARGARLGVLGPNGGGKTTLMKLLLGLLTPQSGVVEVLGGSPREARRRGRIGYVPQRSNASLAFPLSSRRVIEQGAKHALAPWKRTTPDITERVDRAIELTAVQEFADKPIGALSGGMFQRVLIARAMAPGPDVLLLDEPTVGVDAQGQARFAELMATLHRATGVTVVLVSHDLRAIAAGCDAVAVLSRELHIHEAPGGMTPDLLAEVFHHDLALTHGSQPHACGHDHGDRAGRATGSEGAP
ncbi:MAG: metal ABC transporter ATP-binding protein [Planctomycetota bacterium]